MKRVVRPMKFKLDAYKAFCDGLTAKESFVVAARDNNTTLSGCMTDYASSYMSDDIKNFLKRKIVQGNQEVIDYFVFYGLDLNMEDVKTR